MHILRCLGSKFLCEISKGTSSKILNPYTANYAFYCLQFLRVSYDIFELWRHKSLWDGPLVWSVTVWQSVEYETWPAISWYHSIKIGCNVFWGHLGISIVFRGQWPSLAQPWWQANICSMSCARRPWKSLKQKQALMFACWGCFLTRFWHYHS